MTYMTTTTLKTLAIATALLGGVAVGAHAEDSVMDTSPTMDSSPTKSMPAIATPDSRNPDAPVPGRNSFTLKQVETRLVDAGYTHITHVMKGKDGIWRATAVKDGVSRKVTLDYQGNITPAPETTK